MMHPNDPGEPHEKCDECYGEGCVPCDPPAAASEPTRAADGRSLADTITYKGVRLSDIPEMASRIAKLESAKVKCFTFPWTVSLSVDEEGDTIARFVDAPPNVHLTAHGKDANEALTILTEVVKTYNEMIAEEAAASPAQSERPKVTKAKIIGALMDTGGSVVGSSHGYDRMAENILKLLEGGE